jgi:endonuclease/exonuclease/phosphatase family metal-dependent hydrolase
MKSRILSLLVLPLFLLAGTAWSKTLTVTAWNLEWFPGRSPNATAEAQQKHMEAAQKVLKQLNPDIFLAEEIGDWDSFAKLVSVVPKLQVHTVGAFRQGSTIGRQQPAIASCLPANSTWSEPWKPGQANPPRGLAFAALTMPDGKLLFVYAVHLKSNSTAGGGTPEGNRAKREDSAHQLIAHLADMQKAYKGYKILGTVVGGDFNTNLENPDWKNEKTIPTFEDAGFWNTWSGVAPENRLTWKGNGGFAATTFDFFFVKGLGKPAASLWKAAEDASDHEPIILKIEVPDRSAP